MKYRLSLYEARTRLYFFIQTNHPHFKRFGKRICCSADKKFGRLFHLLIGKQKTAVHSRHRRNQLGRIQIEHTLRFGLIAKFLVIAG